MRILMVTPYVPARDGIAAYAQQSVMRLRREGHDVEVLSPGPSAAHHHLDLAGWRGPLALAKRVRAYDKVIVQYHPDIFYPLHTPKRQALRVTMGLAVAFLLCRDLEVRVHEMNYEEGRRPRRIAWVRRMLWRVPRKIVVHSATELVDFRESFGVPERRIQTVEHGADFVPRTRADRTWARNSLGLPKDCLLLLSIGFIQRHKGFDRAIAAFYGLGSSRCKLYVVGSVRSEHPDEIAYLKELRRQAEETSGVEIVARFVSDEEFDRWIVASDLVVLPYRRIWSSGVIERAGLYGRPVIATDVGGLRHQARPNTTIVSDDPELATALRLAVSQRFPEGLSTVEPWSFAGPVRYEEVVKEIEERATFHRGQPKPERTEGPVPLTGYARG